MRKAYDFPGYPYRTVLHDVPKAEALYIAQGITIYSLN